MAGNENRVISGEEIVLSTFVSRRIDFENQRYVAQKPYDLTQYEYSFIKRSFTGDFWCNFFAGGTAGVVISVIGKTVSALLTKKNPELENWELYAILIGVIASLASKFLFRSEDDKAKSKINKIIDSHFQKSKNIVVYTDGQENRDEI
jgi:hypothetical protein